MKNKSLILLMFLTLAIPFFGLFDAQLAFADNSDFISSVDVMKYTKDTMQNQFTDAQIEAVVGLIMQNINPKYIAISTPLDDTADYPALSRPGPRSSILFTQKWVDSIHSHGASVIFRGTFSGIEGIYNFPKLVGANRFPPGTAESASTDGNSTWLGKIYQYIINNPNLFSSNDIWAILPERTEGIFQDATSFLSSNPTLQSNYVNFFLDLKKVSATAFAKIGKNVKIGYTANNFSEIASGWMLPALYTTESMIAVDHYGITHTTAEMENDLRTASKKYGKPIFLQEWGDYWNSKLSEADRTAYLSSMYSVFTKLVNEKVLVGFNYWGGWVNDAEGILTQVNGSYKINYRGQMLADFFAGLTGTVATTPNPTLAPAPVSTPPPVPMASVMPTPTPQATPPLASPVAKAAPKPNPPPSAPAITSPVLEAVAEIPSPVSHPNINLFEDIPIRASASTGETLPAKPATNTKKIMVFGGVMLLLGLTLVRRRRKAK